MVTCSSRHWKNFALSIQWSGKGPRVSLNLSLWVGHFPKYASNIWLDLWVGKRKRLRKA
jgi:hypothetical protein